MDCFCGWLELISARGAKSLEASRAVISIGISLSGTGRGLRLQLIAFGYRRWRMYVHVVTGAVAVLSYRQVEGETWPHALAVSWGDAALQGWKFVSHVDDDHVHVLGGLK